MRTVTIMGDTLFYLCMKFPFALTKAKKFLALPKEIAKNIINTYYNSSHINRCVK